MKNELAAILEQERLYAADAREADEREAAAARATGDMPRAFDLSTCLVLADVSWALEDWAEARRWYAHNADVLIEARAWHGEHSGQDYPQEAAWDWEAATLVKAGRVSEGRDRLAEAIAYRREQPGSELVVAHLALHAAQVGNASLAGLIEPALTSRQEAAEVADGSELQLVRAGLHYEPAQVRLLLGDWHGFREELERLEEATRILGDAAGRVYPPEIERATVAAARGFRAVSELEAQTIEPELGARQARDAFESAMVAFHRVTGWVAPELYFMRLNVRLADQLGREEPLDPNPFASVT